MAIEFATGYVSLIPSLKGAGKSISSQLGGINMAPIGAKMGASLGAKMGSGLKTSMKSQVSTAIMAPVNAAIERQSTATRNLGSAERDLTKARAGQQSAQAKVLKAEEKLESLRSSGKASSGELKAAEADLNAAKVALADSNLKVGSSEDAATRAKESATKANADYIESLKQSSSAISRVETALPVIGARMQEVGTQWKDAGTKISGVGKSMSMKFTAPVLGAATAVGGLVGALGFKRLVGIDTARGQFKGLGYDADKVMAQVDKGVTGTALSMADGASMAVGILATGAVPMEKLEAQIQRTANVSAAYGVEGSHAANLLNAVLTKNKVTYGDLSQMQANGIPIISQLAKHYGVAGDEIEKMARDGKISIEDMNQVLDKNAGAAAIEYSKTWAGVTSNIKSNIGKIGADVLNEIFPQLKTQAEGFLETLKSPAVRGFAKDLGVTLGEALKNVSNGIKGVVGWFTGLSPEMQKTALTIAGLVVAAGPVLIVVGKLATGIGAIITVAGKMVPMLGLAVKAWKLLSLAFTASPIGFVIALVAGLVAGLVWFFTQTEIGREIWGGFVNWLKDLWTGISEFFSGLWAGITKYFAEAILNVVSYFKMMGTVIPALWNALWSAVGNFFRSFWEGLKAFVRLGIEFIKALFFKFHPLGIIIANWQPIVAFVKGLFDSIKTKISTALTAVRTTISNITNGIRNAWNAAWSAIGAFLSKTWATMKLGVSTALNAVSSVIRSILGFIRGIWTGAWNGIKTMFTKIWASIVSAAGSFGSSVKTAFSRVIDFVRGIPGKIVGFFTGMGSKLVASGRSLIGGFLDGIMAGFNKAKQAVSNGLSKIRNLFPFSPAKEGPFSGRGWVAYSGLSIGETFSETIADSLKDGRGDISDELGGIQDEFNDFSNEGFRVSSSLPDFEGTAAGGLAGGAGGAGVPLIHIENMTVDSDGRVKQVAQELYTRASRANRAQGAVQIGGAVV